jgi:hypothetical protein
MIELLGLLFGGAFRLMPEVFKLFTQKRDQEHEFRMTELQLKIDEKRAQFALDQTHATADAAEQAKWADGLVEALKGQGQPTGVKWVDALSSSVRPVLTYWHCLVLYTSYKVALGYTALAAGVAIASVVSQSYTAFDQQLVGSMVGFWFVDRSLRKAR